MTEGDEEKCLEPAAGSGSHRAGNGPTSLKLEGNDGSKVNQTSTNYRDILIHTCSFAEKKSCKVFLKHFRSKHFIMIEHLNLKAFYTSYKRTVQLE